MKPLASQQTRAYGARSALETFTTNSGCSSFRSPQSLRKASSRTRPPSHHPRTGLPAAEPRAGAGRRRFRTAGRAPRTRLSGSGGRRCLCLRQGHPARARRGMSGWAGGESGVCVCVCVCGVGGRCAWSGGRAPAGSTTSTTSSPSSARPAPPAATKGRGPRAGCVWGGGRRGRAIEGPAGDVNRSFEGGGRVQRRTRGPSLPSPVL